jgi:hypothetical protein
MADENQKKINILDNKASWRPKNNLFTLMKASASM